MTCLVVLHITIHDGNVLLPNGRSAWDPAYHACDVCLDDPELDSLAWQTRSEPGVAFVWQSCHVNYMH